MPDTPVVVGTLASSGANGPWSFTIAAVPSGSTVVVAVQPTGINRSSLTLAVSDGVTTYNVIPGASDDGHYGVAQNISVFYNYNVTSLTSGGTITITPSSSPYVAYGCMAIALYLPAVFTAPFVPLDQATTGSGNSATMSSGSVTTTADGIVFGFFATEWTTHPTSVSYSSTSLTKPAEVVVSGAPFGNYLNLYAEYQVSSVSTYDPFVSLTGTSTWQVWSSATVAFFSVPPTPQISSDSEVLTDTAGTTAALGTAPDSLVINDTATTNFNNIGAETEALTDTSVMSAQPPGSDAIALIEATELDQDFLAGDSFSLGEFAAAGVPMQFNVAAETIALSEAAEADGQASDNSEVFVLYDNAAVTFPASVEADSITLNEAAIVFISTPQAPPYGRRWPEPVISRSREPLVIVASPGPVTSSRSFMLERRSGVHQP